MKVQYQAMNGEEDLWIDEHDSVSGVPHIGDAVDGDHQYRAVRYRVVDVIWRLQSGTVTVILKRQLKETT